jgi:hypothetical protein
VAKTVIESPLPESNVLFRSRRHLSSETTPNSRETWRDKTSLTSKRLKFILKSLKSYMVQSFVVSIHGYRFIRFVCSDITMYSTMMNNQTFFFLAS